MLDYGQYFKDDLGASNYVVIILNQPIKSHYFELIYRRAKAKICADGGYHQLKTWLKANDKDLKDFYPDYVIGDFDSLNEGYHDDRIKWIHDSDQSICDFQKCLYYARKHLEGKTFLVFGALGGRLDHEIASLSVLYEFHELSIVFIEKKSLMTLVQAGTNQLIFDLDHNGPHCGFAPFKDKVRVSTEGFEWNLACQDLELGKMISSSNILNGAKATIETSSNIIFTIELK